MWLKRWQLATDVEESHPGSEETEPGCLWNWAPAEARVEQDEASLAPHGGCWPGAGEGLAQ